MPLLSEPVKPVGELKNWDFFIEFVEKGINGSSSAVVDSTGQFSRGVIVFAATLFHSFSNKRTWFVRSSPLKMF